MSLAGKLREMLEAFTGSDRETAERWATQYYEGGLRCVAAELVLILSEQIGVPIDAIRPDSRFIEDLRADGLETVEVILAVEEHFQIPLPDEVCERLSTVHDLIMFIQQRGQSDPKLRK